MPLKVSTRHSSAPAKENQACKCNYASDQLTLRWETSGEGTTPVLKNGQEERTQESERDDVTRAGLGGGGGRGHEPGVQAASADTFVSSQGDRPLPDF